MSRRSIPYLAMSALTVASACDPAVTVVSNRPPTAQASCGDGSCGTTESCAGCPADCGACCQPESDAVLCAQLGKACGSLDAVDQCGNSRSIACGTCPVASAICRDNVCVPSLPAFEQRYVLYFGNLELDATVDELGSIMTRAAAAGYNGVLLGDRGAQYQKLDWEPPSYFEHFVSVRATAATLGLQLIPYSFSQGQGVWRNPEIAEAVPCRATPLRAVGGVARIDDASEILVNPGFESFVADQPTGWLNVDSPGVVTFVDTTTVHTGAAAIRLQDPGSAGPYGHARLMQEIITTPFRAYAISMFLKTEDFSSPSSLRFYVEGLDGANTTLYSNRAGGLGTGASVAATQDWTPYTVYFNSLGNSRVRIYVGAWAPGASGRFWVDDVSVREVALVDVVRRASSPVVVTSADGVVTYVEGTDFLVGTEELTLPAGSAIADGERLAVSYFQAAHMTGPAPASICQPRYWDVQADISGRLHALFGAPQSFMIIYDEWRVANWDPACGGTSGGQYLARAIRDAQALLWTLNPAYTLYVWSDMYDPNVNALAVYWLVQGDLTGSWEGIDPRTTVVTWTGGSESLAFFAGRGLRQMVAGYYESLDNVDAWMDAIEIAQAQGATGITGFLYTTWTADYTQLEAVAQRIAARGRWPSLTSQP